MSPQTELSDAKLQTESPSQPGLQYEQRESQMFRCPWKEIQVKCTITAVKMVKKTEKDSYSAWSESGTFTSTDITNCNCEKKCDGTTVG